jgi:hypothetical protein
VQRLILSDESVFWKNYANYCIIMKATMAALKEFDGKQPCIGNVYIIMRALRRHMVALQNTPFNAKPSRQTIKGCLPKKKSLGL